MSRPEDKSEMFKEGDRVRVVDPDDGDKDPFKGEVGVVDTVFGDHYGVSFHHPGRGLFSLSSWCYADHELEAA